MIFQQLEIGKLHSGRPRGPHVVVVVMMVHLGEHVGLRRLARAHRMHHIWRLLRMKVVLIHIEV